ncbi:hypothetical protein LX32DRAFT_212226 [Colletotrichum zoysiae]|uniref:Uncharacterized protein n=1 Tax=Colletotrichum zoysiae TaxID=1216348 RepID=A0AAD9LV00_9PEZI|nr:hypothetical protein LX32DRAFT_212226 [Colletotrichum zoysiae]
MYCPSLPLSVCPYMCLFVCLGEKLIVAHPPTLTLLASRTLIGTYLPCRPTLVASGKLTIDCIIDSRAHEVACTLARGLPACLLHMLSVGGGVTD